MRAAITWLSAFFVAALIGVAATACSTGQDKPVPEVSLAELAANQEHYNDQQISTSGTVREFSDSGESYYVLEDDNQDRVALEPAQDAAPYVGKEVTVTGRFAFGQDTGRRIEVTTISVATPARVPSGTTGTSDAAQPGGHFSEG